MIDVGVETDDNSVSLTMNGGEKRKVFVTRERADKFQMEGAEDKKKVDTVVNPEDPDSKERVMRLVLKKASVDFSDFPGESRSKSPAENYITRWNMLRNAGVPTVRSMKIVNADTVAMGDMTNDGSAFFGKAIFNKLAEGRDHWKRALSPIEKKFLDVDIEKVREEVERVIRLAWKNGIKLPFDDPYDLLVHPNGSFEVLVIDLTQLETVGNDNDDDLDWQVDDICREIEIMKDHYKKIEEKGNERQ